MLTNVDVYPYIVIFSTAETIFSRLNSLTVYVYNDRSTALVFLQSMVELHASSSIDVLTEKDHFQIRIFHIHIFIQECFCG